MRISKLPKIEKIHIFFGIILTFCEEHGIMRVFYWEVTYMNFLEERIVKDGIVKHGNVLKVDSFLNHQMDIALMEEIGREFKRRSVISPSPRL